MRSLLRTSLTLFAASVVGCSSGEPAPRACVPNEQRSCLCSGGGTGFQSCNADGAALSACDCSAASPDAGSTDGGAPPNNADAAFSNPSKYNTVLGRPTDDSIAISVLAEARGDSVSVEFGTATDAAKTAIVGGLTTSAMVSAEGEPVVVELTGLSPDTLYYYRVHYTPAGKPEVLDNLHTFRTQRTRGHGFHFGVQGDTHPERYNNKMFHPELFTLTMEQVRDRQPDFYFMLGDDFSIEKIIQNFKDQNYPAGHLFRRAVEGVAGFDLYSALTKPFSMAMIVDGVAAPTGNAAYKELRQKYLGIMASATSLFLVNGNHEQAHAANLGGIFNNASVWAADARLKYYPLPAPDGFYSGDNRTMSSVNGYPTIRAPDGRLRDYYAFEWGDALFVSIDPYWHSEKLSPDSTLFNGDREDEWDASMGDEQYFWLKDTLEKSTAKWKFVFAHHVNGNNRGAAAIVGRAEWGGPEFRAKRPTWPKPIHQLLADTKVTIFFQGHDHMYSREMVDGVIYQEVPNPADNSYFAYNCDAYTPSTISWAGPAGYGVYDASWGVKMPNGGFLDIGVEADHVTVEYVRTYRSIDLSTNPNKVFKGTERNGEIAFRYSVPPQPGDSVAADHQYTCIGAAPPAGWKYNR